MTSNDPVSAGGHSDDLTGYEVLIGVTGGIAVYKVCAVVSALVQRGAGVTCLMTRAATRFVRPLTFEALSGRQVLRSLWRSEHSYDPQHIRLSERADLFLLAPATANMLAKIAHGIADDLLSTVVTSLTCPVLVAPAMNHAMWANPIVQSNVATLKGVGYTFLGPAEGWQACRAVGVGRMVEPPAIVEAVADTLQKQPPRPA